jgi:hypothetical protein
VTDLPPPPAPGAVGGPPSTFGAPAPSAPARPSPPSVTGDPSGVNPGAILLLIAGATSVLCWLGPWFTFDLGGVVNESAGREEYGQLWALLVLGIAVAGLAVGFVTRPAPQGVRVAAIIGVCLLVLVYVVQALDWLNDYTDPFVGDLVDPGWAAIISPILPVTAVLGAVLFRGRARPKTTGYGSPAAPTWGTAASPTWGSPGSGDAITPTPPPSAGTPPPPPGFR